jgi:6,7-dimethyl-8-ribityllumazine synthase
MNGAEQGRVVEGTFVHHGGRYAIVASRFNDALVKELVAGCQDGFRRHGVPADHLVTVWVPGAFELPLVCHRLAATGKYAGVVALGCVIRGDTSHYDHVTSAVTAGVAHATQSTGVPVIFGVLTTDSLEQAWARAGTKQGNNGFKASLAALEMASVLRALAEG